MSDNLSAILPFLPLNLNNKRVLLVDNSNDEESVKLFLNQNVSKLVVLNLNNQSTSNQTSANVEYIQSDVNTLNLTGQSHFDLIYVNPNVLSSLNTDADLTLLFERTLQYLNHSDSNDTGYLLFRDACHETQRTPIKYIDLVESRIIENEQSSTSKWGYTLIFVKSNNFKSSLVSFMFQKTKLEDFHGFKTLREFMDHKQYSRRGVLTYEKIFGDGFVSTGGLTTTERFVKEYIKPEKGQRLLDVGCGIGGGDFYIADNYGVEVFGMDLSSNMISIAWERSNQHPNSEVHFEIGDITKQRFPDESFDIIYSRDTILHIPNKEQLFAQFKKWLKPGGKVFITDYCAGPKSKWSDEFKTYVSQRGYNLREVPAYGSIFSDLGFKNVQAVDVTNIFVESLEAELVKMNEIKDTFLNEFSEQDFNYLIDGWKAKLVRCANGDQKWGLFYCEK